MTAPAARTLHTKLLAHGWHATITEGTGHVDVQTLGEPRGDGTRPKLVAQVACRSVAVRAQHRDGRALRAVWETHTVTPKKKIPAWTGVMAWRGRDDEAGEHGPVELSTDDLADYITRSHAAEVYGLEQAA